MRHDEDSHTREEPAGGGVGGAGARAMWWAMGALLLLRLPLMWLRKFDPDEFEHAHAAWSFFRGMIPYQDFFEHHTPWYYVLLRPFFRWFAVDTDFASATHFLLLGRVLSLLLTILSVALTVAIGRRLVDRRTGLLAGLLLLGQPVFLQKSLEMRPDMLGLPFLLGGLWLVLAALRRQPQPQGGPSWPTFFAGGLALGGAVMCTQKMLFVFPGMFGALGLWVLFAGRRPWARIVAIIAVLVGVAVPCLGTWAAFRHVGAGGAFITNNFLLNAGWKHTVTGQFLKLLESSAPVLALAAWAVVVFLRRFLSARPRDYGQLMVAFTTIGLFLGVLVIPVAQRQYYLMPLPMACFFAARGGLALVERARNRRRATVVAAVALAVLPLVALGQDYADRNDQQLARLHHVFDTTKPTDLVMDGWEGTGVFRPHAFYYFFIHEELLPMLSQARLDAYLSQLETGAVRPKLIALDENLTALGPRFLAFVKAHYRAEGPLLYYRAD
jgi:uncharacterized membrane protein